MACWTMGMLFEEASRILSPAFLLCLHITHVRSSGNPLDAFCPPRVQIGHRERLAAAARNGLKQFLQGFRTALRPRQAAGVASKFVWDLMQNSNKPWVFNDHQRDDSEASLQYDDEPPKPIIHATLCFLRELLLGEHGAVASNINLSAKHTAVGSRNGDVVAPNAPENLNHGCAALPQSCGTENHQQVDNWSASFALHFRQSFLTALWGTAPKFISEAVPSELCALNRAMALAAALSADLRLWAGADTMPRQSKSVHGREEPASCEAPKAAGTRSWLVYEADRWHHTTHQIRVVNILALATRDVQIDRIPIVRLPVKPIGVQHGRIRSCDDGRSIGAQLDVLGTFTAALGALQLADVDDSDSSARASACRDDVTRYFAASDKTKTHNRTCNDCDFWTDVLPELVRVLPLTLPSSLVPPDSAVSESTTVSSSQASTPSSAGTLDPSTQTGTSAQVNIRRLALCKRMVWLAASQVECRADATPGASSGHNDQNFLQLDMWSVSLNAHRLNFLFHRVKAAIDESNRRNLWSPCRRECLPFDIQALSRVQIGIAQFNSHLSLFQSFGDARPTANPSLDASSISSVELSMQVICAYCMWEVQLRPLLVACLNGFPFHNAYRAEMSVATSGRPYHDILITYLPLINECARTLRILERAVRETGWPLNVRLSDRRCAHIAQVAGEEFADDGIIAWVKTFDFICMQSGALSSVIGGQLSSKAPPSHMCTDAFLICIQRHAQLLRTALMVGSLNFGANVDPATSSPHVDNFAKKLPFADVWLRANELFTEHIVPSRAPIFIGFPRCSSPLQAGCIARSGAQIALLGASKSSNDGHCRHAMRFLSALLSHRLYELRGARIWGTGMEVEADVRFIRGLVECARLTWSDVEREVVLPHALGRCDDLRAFKSLHSLLQDIRISAPDWDTQEGEDDAVIDQAALPAPARRWTNILQHMSQAEDILLQSVPRLSDQTRAATIHEASPDVAFSKRVFHVHEKVVILRHQLVDFAARRIVVILQRLCERNFSILTEDDAASSAFEYVVRLCIFSSNDWVRMCCSFTRRNPFC